ncbi:MAG: hypothetical protein DSM107014_02155 [Gomphosphaeria aponina SAG 52.96 = DSM 107014]|uniref:Uncharacterized protein n=1 Tax=Gomphosphaeria aponina SAG 52.96 = DSM 107014 TaxID=1521640 RepID=A0A941GVA1_9CHRO|nr:hypothetical protein [Gomphosphaeria aponina SAG 52.96 = DSM 107014]
MAEGRRLGRRLGRRQKQKAWLLYNHQPSTINHQPSTINHQSTINYQPSTMGSLCCGTP